MGMAHDARLDYDWFRKKKSSKTPQEMLHVCTCLCALIWTFCNALVCIVSVMGVSDSIYNGVCAEPLLKKANENEPELIINSDVSNSDGTMSGNTFTVNLPAISLEHGPFRLVYYCM